MDWDNNNKKAAPQQQTAPNEQLNISFPFKQAQKKGDQYFKEGKILDAIKIYQKIIEGGYTVDFAIQGLGNLDHTIYRYQWFIYKWYDQQRSVGIFKGNVFDALSLCYAKRNLQQSILQQGIIWYEDRLGEKLSYQLYVGFANILYNKGRYDQALKYYNKVIELKPDLVNAYVSIAFLYQFRRIEKQKVISMCNIILEKDPQNMCAFFLLGKNEKDTDEKIKKFTIAAQKFPTYLRLVNQVGLSYGAKNNHEMAIQWYKKCIVIAPQYYAQGYQNVAYRMSRLEKYEQALTYYYRAVEIDPKYKQAFINAIDTFKKLNFTDDNIIEETKKYPKMDTFNFYYYLGLAYYDKKDTNSAIVWYKRAEQINEGNYSLANSMGLAYENSKDYQNGEKYYLKSIQINPKYKYPYYNLGLLQKHKKNMDKSIEWYLKAIQIDPHYYPPFNNLGNIYRERGQYDKAIEYYRKCVETNSTYTLVYANLAVCFLNQEMYKDAFNAFKKAKQLLPFDNNGLTEGNKKFLKENLDKFEKEGEVWIKVGSISSKQKQILRSLIKLFQSNFKQMYSSEASVKISNEKALKPQIIQIINLIYEDKFSLKNIGKIFTLIKEVFSSDEECFHILPQYFIQYFWKNTFERDFPILQIESELKETIKAISIQEFSDFTQKNPSPLANLEIKLKNYSPPSSFKINLFKETSYFNSYESLYSQLDKVNAQAEGSLAQFVGLVDSIRLRSNGNSSWVNMKIPKQPDQQFKTIIRILEQMFKEQINDARMMSIIAKIDQQLKREGKNITLVNIVHEIVDVWTKQITLILEERFKNKIETVCNISDLVRGNIFFNNAEGIYKALQSCDKLCFLGGYDIIELDKKIQEKEVILKIKINNAVCMLQLKLKQFDASYKLIEQINEIQQSHLGCIFGSYLYMTKGFSYPFLTNCKDILSKLESSEKQSDKKIVQAARYIMHALEVENKQL